MTDTSQRPSPEAPTSKSLAPSEGQQYHTKLLLAQTPPCVHANTRHTARRMQNLIQSRFDARLRRETVNSYPVKLTVESTNVCNLRCPACFTGTGEIGRPKGQFPPDLYRRLIAELGPYLYEIELHNWGEPLLGRHVFDMIRHAHEAGISTSISTNFSFPFDDEAAERLVATGLSVLGASIDGARQETYEQYRVRGDLALVLDNCRRLASAKRRLGSTTPRFIWSFHAFGHNLGDIDLAKSLAAELGMEFALSKGWVVGKDWDTGHFFEENPGESPIPAPCHFLWHQAVVNNDGGVAPCCGSFYREDDVGKLQAEQGDGGSQTFFDVWNGERQRLSRSFFKSRDVPEEHKKLICHDCPVTALHERWLEYFRTDRLEGKPWRDSIPIEKGFNFFFDRRPAGTPEERRVIPLRRKPAERRD